MIKPFFLSPGLGEGNPIFRLLTQCFRLTIKHLILYWKGINKNNLQSVLIIMYIYSQI